MSSSSHGRTCGRDSRRRRSRICSSPMISAVLVILGLYLQVKRCHASGFWGGGTSHRRGGGRLSPQGPSSSRQSRLHSTGMAFLSKKKNSFNFPNNQSTSLFTTGSSVLHLNNCSVTLLSLDPNGVPNANGARGSKNITTTAAVNGRSPLATSNRAGGPATTLDLVIGEAVQTIGGALFEALCFYVAGRIIMGVRGFWGRAFTRPTGIRFADIIGCDYAKEEVLQLVEYLKNPTKYNKLGAKIPR